MRRDELNNLLNATEEELDAQAEEYETDTWNASSLGKVTAGRPPLFNEAMMTVTFKEPKDKIAAIDKRATSLHMSRSEYLRWVTNKDLAEPV